MINYEKIKLGKGLTRNQKRLREIYLEHQLHLEGNPIKERDELCGHKICKVTSTRLNVSCSRALGDTFLVYDGKQKENIKLHIETRCIRKWGQHFAKYFDDVYVIIGKKNIVRLQQGNCYNHREGCYVFYDNNNILRNITPEINHRKKEGGISLYKEFEGGL